MVKKKKYNIWKRLHFKYRLSAINENTLEEMWRIRASLFSGGVLVLLFALLLVTFTSIIIIATPIRYYLPGYMDAEVREKALRSAIQFDSLEQKMRSQETYAENVRKILTGDIQIDSINYTTIDTIALSENDPSLKKSQIEQEYVNKYEEEEKYNLSILPPSVNVPIDGIIFFKPAKGTITQKFNPAEGQYGVSIKISGRETISSTLEGTIIYTGYDLNNGYIVQIQHKNGFVSIYRRIDNLVKKPGDQVKTGEAIAVIDTNTQSQKEEDKNLEFELWYRGNSINPEDYIFF